MSPRPLSKGSAQLILQAGALATGGASCERSEPGETSEPGEPVRRALKALIPEYTPDPPHRALSPGGERAIEDGERAIGARGAAPPQEPGVKISAPAAGIGTDPVIR